MCSPLLFTHIGVFQSSLCKPTQRRNQHLTDLLFSVPLLEQSQAIKTPTAVYCSGQIPLTPEGTFIEGTIGEKTAQCCKNVKAVIEASGSSVSKVVKTTIFLSDMGHFAVSLLNSSILSLHHPPLSRWSMARGHSIPPDLILYISTNHSSGNEHRVREVVLPQAGSQLRCCQDPPQECGCGD